MTTITPWEKRIGASNDWDEFIQALKAEIAEHRALKERVESQEPVATVGCDDWGVSPNTGTLANIDVPLPTGTKLYALPPSPVNAELVEAASDVLEKAPCDCSHKRRYEDGEHLSECYLFDLNLALSNAQAKPALTQEQVKKVREKLEYIASFSQTENLLWWQIEAREAIEITKGAL